MSSSRTKVIFIFEVLILVLCIIYEANGQKKPTVTPGLKPKPSITVTPGLKPKPSITVTPGLKPKPSITVTPGLKPKPSITVTPGLKPKPSITVTPGLKPKPSITVTPGLKPKPSIKVTPGLKPKPSITIGPVTGKPPITIGPVKGKPPITIGPVTGKPPITIGPVDGEDEGFETAGESEAEKVVAIEEALESVSGGSPSMKDAETLDKLKENLTMEFTESSGKDWGDLSTAVLKAAWDNNGNKTEISVMELMVWFDNVGGEDRLHLLRLLELMDKNMNGLLSKEEFISMYSGPMASPDKAIELLHRVSDYDGNGFISIWESLTQVLTVDGINRNIYDKYREARYHNKQKDSNNDLIINLHEFTSYIVWQINIGIGVQKVRQLPALVISKTN